MTLGTTIVLSLAIICATLISLVLIGSRSKTKEAEPSAEKETV